jgi:hypothetical protein
MKRTGVSVITGQVVVYVGTTTVWCAYVCGAGVAVVTIQDTGCDAGRVVTLISSGTGIFVVANSFNRGVVAIAFFRAAVFRARVVVVTGQNSTSDTGSVQTSIVERAWVSIAAGCVFGLMVTTTSRQTEISGTRVRIVTFERAHSRAIAITAYVVGRTFVQVIAQCTRVDM